MQAHLVALALAVASTSAIAAPRADSELAELAERRAQAIDWLAEYVDGGWFPIDGAGNPISVFQDSRGARCPMAELVYRSGRADLVEAVARDNNTVRLADVTSGPLHDWMLASGLTRSEIDLVQGVLNYSTNWIPPEAIAPAEQKWAARAQVRGKLESALAALRSSTRHSLLTAQRALGKRRVAALAATEIRPLVRIVPAASARPTRDEIELAPRVQALRVQPARDVQTLNAP